MFQDMSKKLNVSMEPIKELMEIQTRMLEKLTEQQIECAKACMNQTMSQTRELQSCGSAQELIELQKKYTQTVEATLKNASSENLETFNEAREAIERLTQNTFDAFAPKK
ncbi:phasin family protein [Motiliproteus coralliicola]|uniref:Phasin family protein n=2 Tax=Motiliproteus coralliicola TaxID=2283196 RepID=A0A369WWW3_9GAMM|nr:phasin family protein [Motiliproteus coralliicola]